MNNITFLYLTFGENLNNHSQAVFSLLTVKKFSPENAKFVVYTDQPKFYQWVSSFVEIIYTPNELLLEWEGEHNFFWRVKIMAMLDHAQKNAGHLIYLDSDTFAFSSLSTLASNLDRGDSFMHLAENTLSSDQAPDKKLLWIQTQNKRFGEILIDKNSIMWNAGVVALPANAKIKILQQALSCNDELCAAKVTRRLIEQFSLSLSLTNNSQINEASGWIGHYWGNKEEWNQKIMSFFSMLLQNSITAESSLESIDIELWKKIPIIRSSRSLHRRMIKMADKISPDSVSFVK